MPWMRVFKNYWDFGFLSEYTDVKNVFTESTLGTVVYHRRSNTGSMQGI